VYAISEREVEYSLCFCRTRYSRYC